MSLEQRNSAGFGEGLADGLVVVGAARKVGAVDGKGASLAFFHLSAEQRGDVAADLVVERDFHVLRYRDGQRERRLRIEWVRVRLCENVCARYADRDLDLRAVFERAVEVDLLEAEKVSGTFLTSDEKGS